MAVKNKKTQRRFKIKANIRSKVSGTVECPRLSVFRSNKQISAQLIDDVEKLGEHRFTREILYYCPNRGTASYLEAQEQFERKVLETDDYYNGIINVRIGGSNILRESLKKYSKN